MSQANYGRHFSRKEKEIDKEMMADANYPLYRAPFYPNIFRMKKIR